MPPLASFLQIDPDVGVRDRKDLSAVGVGAGNKEGLVKVAAGVGVSIGTEVAVGTGVGGGLSKIVLLSLAVRPLVRSVISTRTITCSSTSTDFGASY